ncbi:alternative ribosome-rescue factor A [Phocoenobacter skyensis]|uniref:Alternative ribosome-rescue factor n=1 Tax=Phocoenobacter skyensis TaxID=97481 RepID=A0A1H8A7B4_9PAST|nr:ribosome alternative rescue factor ArfA [Pasteurella skyensis]MDP8079761.1 ribosome alternative rescue factor ArfA [Pasteurella skyensis]MDP8085664.1 ribosome alternative rescue factor ArfA [Pasteurella skyensis]MDP8162089.1 ribosome alternative rescue factor ArfA [Pasteurella skyensis]MDP8170065.1 ribosome alternative rescue factor ArfA [Pasteurella skyensis]MDP8172948.1 ribosome alternative rescue factor ArfA [Pasteurella skyensis]
MTKLNYDHQRGEIKESVIKAMVTDPLFRTRIVKSKKGKGSYQRKEKHRKAYSKGESPFKQVLVRIYLNGLF